MTILRSYLEGRWMAGEGKPRTIEDATTGSAFATVASDGLDRGAALRYARDVGGPALRAMTFAERGAILKKLAEEIHTHRDELLILSRQGGTTRGDGKFDVDGAAGTISYYAYLGKKLGDVVVLADGEPENVLRSKRFVGQHLLVPRRGVAIHINAFNFPAWGMAEKAAVAILAGVPVISKPGTATAPLAVRIVELWVESGALPEGAFSLLAGSAGDLLDHVGPQDCVAFTGSSGTGLAIRSHAQVLATGARVNVEADSLNASVLAPDVELDSDTFGMFLGDVARDMTQKAGQKCTAVRRIVVPADKVDGVAEALIDRISGAIVGDPAQRGITVGPVASRAQKRDVEAGCSQLAETANLVWRGEAPEGDGFFVAPALYLTDAGVEAAYVHEHEVFGPVATLVTYDGSSDEAIAIVAAGGGGLVASVYTDDAAWGGQVMLGIAPWSGRIYWGSRKVADQGSGPGTVLPNFVHGGPGKAGGGEELGGERGLRFYQQRVAVQADRALLKRSLEGLL